MTVRGNLKVTARIQVRDGDTWTYDDRSILCRSLEWSEPPDWAVTVSDAHDHTNVSLSDADYAAIAELVRDARSRMDNGRLWD